jgi:alpha-beta hydrolase superfamily lysophospholipase
MGPQTSVDAGAGRVDFGLTRDGLVQLRRHWPAQDPRAVVLLIHGIAEHSGRYEHVGRALAERRFDVVAIDLRGFGKSGGRRAHVSTFDDYLDDVEDQLAELRVLHLPVVLLGHSMGGLIALSYAMSARPRPDLLALSAPALGANIPAPLRVAAPLLARVVPHLRVPAPISGELLSTDPAVGAAYDADPLIVRATTPALGAALIRQMQWANAHLDQLTVPTLVLHGADDQLVPARSTRDLGDRPLVTRRAYPSLRHELFNEPAHPSIVRDLADWLEGQLAQRDA